MVTKAEHRYIAVEGPIGAGKSTVAKMLAEDLGARLILEPVEKNPFLSEFYKDRKKNAFKTQLFYLLNRCQQQQELSQQDLFEQTTVCDYIFAKDLIFAGLNLSEGERELYNTVYRLLDAKVPKPDIVVYLQAEPEVLIKRIKQRDHSYEMNLDIDYLEQLTNAYNDFFFNYSSTPLLIVNSNDQDIVKQPDDWASLKKAILAHKTGTAHHHYVGR